MNCVQPCRLKVTMAATIQQSPALEQIVCRSFPPSPLHRPQCKVSKYSLFLPSHTLKCIRLRRSKLSCLASASSSTSTSMYAKEMERVAAKEALLLAIKDAGGDNVLSPATANAAARIDVNERIVSLERLNPTPRPTTSPMLEGVWQFKWIGAGSPGQMAASVLLQRFPSAFVTISELNISIFDGSAKATATLKVFNMIISSVILTSKLSVEGPLRLKEEYVEGVLLSPTVQESSIPAQVQNVYEQFLNAVQRLPEAVKETISNGVKFSLAGTFERQLLLSYLDDEILVARDGSGVPEVLLRLSGRATVDVEPAPEYLS